MHITYTDTERSLLATLQRTPQVSVHPDSPYDRAARRLVRLGVLMQRPVEAFPQPHRYTLAPKED